MLLSVLDQSPIRSGGTAADALAESVRLAQLTEALGYHRYWVAEHHGSQSFAGSSPEILVGRIAAATNRIRVGSGGVMLMHYSPLKVAENFRLLGTLHPGRIDLGVGRAPGSDGITAAALAYGSQIGIEYFPAKILDLRAFLTGETAYTEALRTVTATPAPVENPEFWLLGSSDSSASLAAELGIPFSFAHFITPHEAEPVMALYRERFKPSATCPEPRASLGVFVLTADTTEHAEALAACRDLWRLRFESGQFGPYPSIEEAQAFQYTDAQRAHIATRREHQILGTAPEVKQQLVNLAGRCGVDELVVVSITHDFDDRVRCYELLASEFSLEGSKS